MRTCICTEPADIKIASAYSPNAMQGQLHYKSYYYCSFGYDLPTCSQCARAHQLKSKDCHRSYYLSDLPDPSNAQSIIAMVAQYVYRPPLALASRAHGVRFLESALANFKFFPFLKDFLAIKRHNRTDFCVHSKRDALCLQLVPTGRQVNSICCSFVSHFQEHDNIQDSTP
jgi:hypothetical protein